MNFIDASKFLTEVVKNNTGWFYFAGALIVLHFLFQYAKLRVIDQHRMLDRACIVIAEKQLELNPMFHPECHPADSLQYYLSVDDYIFFILDCYRFVVGAIRVPNSFTFFVYVKVIMQYIPQLQGLVISFAGFIATVYNFSSILYGLMKVAPARELQYYPLPEKEYYDLLEVDADCRTYEPVNQNFVRLYREASRICDNVNSTPEAKLSAHRLQKELMVARNAFKRYFGQHVKD